MEGQMMAKNNNTNYLILALIVFGINILTLYGYNTFFKLENKNETILLENISNVNNKINNLIEIAKSNSSQITIKDRLDPALIAEFGNDSEFLEKIAKLKKQIVKRELESKIIKLENEKLARNISGSDGDYAGGYKRQTASNIFELMMINATTKKAVIRVEDNIANVGVNDNIRGFVIVDINANQVIMKNPDGDQETLGLSYLTKKIYNQTKNGDKNAK
jgi:hypothetical protein